MLTLENRETVPPRGTPWMVPFLVDGPVFDDAAFGSPEFVEEMERKYGVQLHAKPLGRPRKLPQAALTAAATVSA